MIRGGRPLLVEFWDFCRPNSMRTLPYLKAWHERYGPEGLRIVGVHCPGFEPSRDPDAVRDAVARLGIRHAVLIDSEFEVWQEYGNEGWPSRYLFDGRARLADYHHGEGGYADTERTIQELLAIERPLLEPLRLADAPGARLSPQSEDRIGAYSGPYEAGAVWAVLDGVGSVSASSTAGDEHAELTVAHAGAYALIEHDRHASGTLELRVGEGVSCYATCFTPGLA